MLKTNLQNSIDFKGQNFYVGLDVHEKSWAVTIRSVGIQIAHFTQPPGAETLARYLQRNFTICPVEGKNPESYGCHSVITLI